MTIPVTRAQLAQLNAKGAATSRDRLVAAFGPDDAAKILRYLAVRSGAVIRFEVRGA